MSDHLPECPQIFGKPDWYCCEDCDPGVWDDCICHRLRACEQRVFQEQIKGRQHDMVMAYLRGLDAAREAVESLNNVTYDTALAAIDALREEQK